MNIELIYCANGNKRFAEIAVSRGFLYGARLPGVAHYPPSFSDQDWKKPDRERYMSALAKHRPQMATVLDLEEYDQFEDVLEWAEEAAMYTECVVIIPKFSGAIELIPTGIGGKPVRLGYSVPTSFGGTSVPLWEFVGRPVHLLGGSPQAQLQLAHYLDVASADGNMHTKAAQKWGTYWDGKWIPAQFTGVRDALYTAFDLSCKNIMAAWRKL